MVMVRVTSVLVVLVVASKAALFVADDAKAFEVEALSLLEKRLAQLIDETVRHREEERERREKAMSLSLAQRIVLVRRAILFRATGSIGALRRAARGVQALRYAAASRRDALAAHAGRMACSQAQNPWPKAHAWGRVGSGAEPCVTLAQRRGLAEVDPI